MEEPAAQPSATAPRQSLIAVSQVIYALHTLSIVIGLTSAVTVVGAFVFGVPSIIAVVMNYIYQSEVRGSFLESHFRWQIRTFWFALLWVVIGIPLTLIVVGFAILLGAGIWVIYRVARGWITLQDRRPIQF